MFTWPRGPNEDKQFEDTNHAPVADGIDALIVDDVVIACAVIVTAGDADEADYRIEKKKNISFLFRKMVSFGLVSSIDICQ